jgi:hypothetical protein
MPAVRAGLKARQKQDWEKTFPFAAQLAEEWRNYGK